MYNRGFRTISPDDSVGRLVSGDRLTGKAYRQGRYARRRNWGSGSEEKSDGQVTGPVKSLKLVPWKRESASVSLGNKESTIRAGEVIGWIAMGSLVQAWLVLVLSVLAEIIGSGSNGWSPFVLPSVLLALAGTQLLGFLSDTLSESRSEWGTRALVGFWISFLIWLPLGMLISMMIGLFG
ncbi:hypothetical protein ACFQY0_19030 [Haloferula chungangensis]|uniref:Uncharacterized protein n=1 Tax=Haloferula chungangensis TaxID=1048331 RepID=A0ABW2LCG3_9BACT